MRATRFAHTIILFSFDHPTNKRSIQFFSILLSMAPIFSSQILFSTYEKWKNSPHKLLLFPAFIFLFRNFTDVISRLFGTKNSGSLTECSQSWRLSWKEPTFTTASAVYGYNSLQAFSCQLRWNHWHPAPCSDLDSSIVGGERQRSDVMTRAGEGCMQDGGWNSVALPPLAETKKGKPKVTRCIHLAFTITAWEANTVTSSQQSYTSPSSFTAVKTRSWSRACSRNQISGPGLIFTTFGDLVKWAFSGTAILKLVVWAGDGACLLNAT